MTKDLEALRRRVRSRVPILVDKVINTLKLAKMEVDGPDPEEALEQLRAAHRSLDVFLKLTAK